MYEAEMDSRKNVRFPFLMSSSLYKLIFYYSSFHFSFLLSTEPRVRTRNFNSETSRETFK